MQCDVITILKTQAFQGRLMSASVPSPEAVALDLAPKICYKTLKICHGGATHKSHVIIVVMAKSLTSAEFVQACIHCGEPRWTSCSQGIHQWI